MAILRYLLIALLLTVSCGRQKTTSQPLPKWESGYWFWQGSAAETPSRARMDSVYFQAGGIDLMRFRGAEDQWIVSAGIRNELPSGSAYWAVLRMDRPQIPDASSLPAFARAWKELQDDAAERHMTIAGVQLDIDCPTPSLREYAAFLQQLRKQLPPGWQLSITALLDWFRSGTAIGAVLESVDEFVPQFYDLRSPGSLHYTPAIAAPIDARKWAPVFNKFGRRFKIGISTFGRSRFVPSPNGQAISYLDLRPFDLGINPAFELMTRPTPAREIVLQYRARQNTRISYQDFDAGSTIEFVLSTPEAITTAVAEARKMGDRCGGVLFFRWPSRNETMALAPDEVMTAAGVAAIPPLQPTLNVEDERCAAVHCATLSVTGLPARAPTPLRYRVTISENLEYFLPEKGSPVRLAAPRRLEFILPPYAGRLELRLGRAVAARHATYSLEAVP